MFLKRILASFVRLQKSLRGSLWITIKGLILEGLVDYRQASGDHHPGMHL